MTTQNDIHQAQRARVRNGPGFFAALDQSGGSTPKALAGYGISPDAWSTTEEMFDLVHAMRTRVITAPGFTADLVRAVILFEQTMDRTIAGQGTAEYLWAHDIVPFLKIDKGLADSDRGVQLMRDIPGLDELLERSVGHGVFGTKARSVIHAADAGGIEAVVEQQFALGARVLAHGLVPILEPEVDITIPDKEVAEELLLTAINTRLETLPPGRQVIFKLSLPSTPNFYAGLIADPRVLLVVALSGGYDQQQACRLLEQNHGMVASFSRALLEGLSAGQTAAEFSATLLASLTRIEAASRR